MKTPLHMARPIPDNYASATREAARDPVAFDEVMAHDHYDDDGKPGLILFGGTGSGKTSAAHAKLAELRKDGCIIHHMGAVELSMLVRESATNYRDYARIVRFLAGTEPDGDMAEMVLQCRPEEVLSLFPEVKDDDLFRRWLSPGGILIDDLHVPKLTQAYAMALYTIIEARTARQDALILTSQLAGLELLAKWKKDSPELADTATAIVRRIVDHCHPVHFLLEDSPW